VTYNIFGVTLNLILNPTADPFSPSPSPRSPRVTPTYNSQSVADSVFQRTPKAVRLLVD